MIASFKIKKVCNILSILFIAGLLSSCSVTEQILINSGSEAQAWKLITDSAECTEVVICVSTENEALITWLEDDFADALSQNYNIALKVEAQPIRKTFEKIQESFDLEKELGYYDVIFLNGDDFQTAMNKAYLYGPFSQELPNVAYLNNLDLEMRYDEGAAINGYEIPYAKSQLIMINNEDIFYGAPESIADFIDIIKEHKGQFVYPDPRTSPEGLAFIIGVMAPYLDLDKAVTGDYTKSELFQLVSPALNKLNEMKPYLFEGGTHYPADIETVDRLYRSGELFLSMSLENSFVTKELKTYEYPEESNAFIMPDGATGSTAYVGIAANAPNKSAALVVINALLSPSSQADIFSSKLVGLLPVYDMDETPSEAFSELKAVKEKSTTLSYDETLPYRIPEFSPAVKQALVALWEENVLKETNEE